MIINTNEYETIMIFQSHSGMNNLIASLQLKNKLYRDEKLNLSLPLYKR